MTQTVTLDYGATIPNVPIICSEIWDLVGDPDDVEDMYSQWEDPDTELNYQITVLLADSVGAGTIALIEALETADTGTLVSDKHQILADGADTATITWEPDDPGDTDIDVDVNGNAVTITTVDPLTLTALTSGTVFITPTTRYAQGLILEIIDMPS